MRRLVLSAIAAILAAITAAGGAVYYWQRPTILRVAVPRDSDDQAILASAAHEFAASRESIRLKLVPVETLAESSRALEDRRADLAVVRSDTAMPPSGQTVLIMRRNAALLVAPAQSKLGAIGDLQGRKVGILQGEPGAGRGDYRLLLDTALAQYDVASTSVSRVILTPDDLSRAVERKEVDVILAVGAPGSERLTNAVNTIASAGRGPPVFLPIPEAKAIAQRSPVFEGIEVVRGAFGGALPKPAADFDTLGVSTRLVARNSLSDEAAGALTRLLLAARPRIAARIPAANRIEAPAPDKDAPLPVHPGALAFLDDEEVGFFDKYGDAFYIGAMCLSVLGTALAAATGRLKHAVPTDADRVLGRVVELVKAARSASSAELLDSYAEESDELLGMALAPSVVHSLSANRLGALDLALNQLRNAIAERRLQLAGQARPHFVPRIVRESS
ncbi:MAG TPA: TAXI family TRAP transporter solute-binding subunit [Methylocella sp.]|nr:TAXI family TRAP transporter solute-binding subunit [Methylocella sp.]